VIEAGWALQGEDRRDCEACVIAESERRRWEAKHGPAAPR
jgi:hypothetical protein